MERVLSRVQVVQNYLDHLVMFQNEWVRIMTVDYWICRHIAGGECGV